MTVILDIPDEIAHELTAADEQLSHAALEGLALEGYRRGALTQLHSDACLACRAFRRKTSWRNTSLSTTTTRPSSGVKRRPWPSSLAVRVRDRKAAHDGRLRHLTFSILPMLQAEELLCIIEAGITHTWRMA